MKKNTLQQKRSAPECRSCREDRVHPAYATDLNFLQTSTTGDTESPYFRRKRSLPTVKRMRGSTPTTVTDSLMCDGCRLTALDPACRLRRAIEYSVQKCLLRL
uniref:Uncharacterized protein n=1 Tax=Steinernema glaseri TaxID=37863 RepID=A0A1I7Y601_9BILA